MAGRNEVWPGKAGCGWHGETVRGLAWQVADWYGWLGWARMGAEPLGVAGQGKAGK